MRKLIFLSYILSSIIYAQTEILGDLENYVTDYLNLIPNTSSSNEYQIPPDTTLTKWFNIIQSIILGDISSANLEALNFEYEIVKFIDTVGVDDKEYYVLVKPKTGNNHWGIFIFNPTALRQKLVIQAPHPLYDSNTGKQSLIIFKVSGARALFISGTHRCNSSVFTTCSGTTTACSGTSQSYRISDQAHVVNGTFQRTTETLAQLIDSLVVLQPHGFAKQSGDPDLIMSNGTQITPVGIDYLSEFKNNLLSLDNSLTFKIAHIDLSWTRLIATTNAQGRLLNGSNNPCNLNASSTSGRFLHVEQAYSKLRDSKTNWMKFADAVNMTFPKDPLVYVKHELVQVFDFHLYQNYPNPFNPVTTIKYSIQRKGFVSLKVFDILGKVVGDIVSEIQQMGTYYYRFNAVNLPNGIYLYRIQTGNFVNTKKMILLK